MLCQAVRLTWTHAGRLRRQGLCADIVLQARVKPLNDHHPLEKGFPDISSLLILN